MRIIGTVLLTGCLLAAPAMACGHHHARSNHDFHVSDRTSIDIDGDVAIIAHESRRAADEVRITREGGLTINDEPIETDRKDRKLLSRFFVAVENLNESVESVAEDAEEIAQASEAFAAHAIFAVLRSLGCDDDGDEYASTDGDFEHKIKIIEKIADGIEEQADDVMDLADELRDRIPALDDLGWFLDD